MGYKPHYALNCSNCGINFEHLAINSNINKEDFNYCPICGNELEAPKIGNKP